MQVGQYDSCLSGIIHMTPGVPSSASGARAVWNNVVLINNPFLFEHGHHLDQVERSQTWTTSS